MPATRYTGDTFLLEYRSALSGGLGPGQITAGGTGYTTAPTVSFTGGGGTGATATTTIAAGAVASITITAPGTGYTSAPTVVLAGGGGTGAAAVVALAGTFVVVLGIDKYTSRVNRSKSTHPEFGSTAEFSTYSRPDTAMSANGKLVVGDVGQDALRTAAILNTVVHIRATVDGANGCEGDVRVGSRNFDADAAGGPQTQSFDVGPDSAAITVGTGPLLW